MQSDNKKVFGERIKDILVKHFKIKTSDISREQRFAVFMIAFSRSVSMSSATASYEYDFIIEREECSEVF